MKTIRAWAVAILFVAASPGWATTWMEQTVKDPVSGKDCKVGVPGSWGSYIYQWPEKYDQVFWPLTDPRGGWVCPESGFAAFIGDIELDDAEKSAIAGFLRDAPALGNEPEADAILDRLEALYALRKLDPDRRSTILRAMAYRNEADGRMDKAAALRTQAGRIMEERLRDESLETGLRLQYLFVTANYAREQGRAEESDEKMAQLASLLAAAAGDEKQKDYAEYLDGQIGQARKIAPGGLLAPDD